MGGWVDSSELVRRAPRQVDEAARGHRQRPVAGHKVDAAFDALDRYRPPMVVARQKPAGQQDQAKHLEVLGAHQRFRRDLRQRRAERPDVDQFAGCGVSGSHLNPPNSRWKAYTTTRPADRLTVATASMQQWLCLRPSLVTLAVGRMRGSLIRSASTSGATAQFVVGIQVADRRGTSWG